MRASSLRSWAQQATTAIGVDEPDGHEREPDAQQVDHERREQRADGDPDGQGRLERGEHAGQHRLVGQPGQHRESADVDERVADPHHGEQHDRGRHLGNDAERDQWHAPERDPEAEPGREPTVPDEPEA